VSGTRTRRGICYLSSTLLLRDTARVRGGPFSFAAVDRIDIKNIPQLHLAVSDSTPIGEIHVRFISLNVDVKGRKLPGHGIKNTVGRTPGSIKRALITTGFIDADMEISAVPLGPPISARSNIPVREARHA
jgi:hypothetical protein